MGFAHGKETEIDRETKNSIIQCFYRSLAGFAVFLFTLAVIAQFAGPESMRLVAYIVRITTWTVAAASLPIAAAALAIMGMQWRKTLKDPETTPEIMADLMSRAIAVGIGAVALVLSTWLAFYGVDMLLTKLEQG